MSKSKNIAPMNNEKEARRRLTTVVAADICGYSRLAEINDALAAKTVKIVFSIFEQIASKRDGRVFNRAGDGIFAEFPSALEGMNAALEFLKDIRGRDKLSLNGIEASVRVGIHLGEVIEQPNGDLLGHGVNIAARLQGQAEPNTILASIHIVNFVRHDVEANFRRRGPLALKNINQPITAFDVETTRHPNMFWWRQLKRLWTTRIKTISVPVLAILVTINFVLIAMILNIVSPKPEALSLIASLTKYQPKSDTKQLLAIRDVAESLATSKIDEKKRAKVLIESGNIQEAASLLYLLLKKQETQNEPSEVRSSTLREIGALTFYSKKQWAIEAYEKLFTLSDKTDLFMLIRLADLYIASSQLDKARENYQLILDKKPDTLNETWAHIGLGRFHLRQNNNEEAERHFLYALSLSEENKLLVETARTYVLLNVVAENKGNIDLAEDYARRALSIEQKLRAPERSEHRIAEAHINLGTTVQLRKNYGDALSHFKRALKISESNNDRQNMVISLNNIGKTYFAIENLLEAEKAFNRALAVAGEEKMNNAKFQVTRSLAEIAILRGDIEKACRNYEDAKLYYSNSPDTSLNLFSDTLKENCE